MSHVSRRRLLEILGLAGGTYLGGSFSPSTRSMRSASAASAAVPKRVVFFFTEQGSLRQINADGTLKPFWVPTAASAPDPLKIQTPWSTSTFTLGSMHQPLVPFQNQLLFVDGLDMISANVDPTQASNAHINGETHAMIGANRQTGSLGGGISIDQFIAKGINSPSPLTSLASLEIFLDGNQTFGAGEEAPLYASSGQPIPISGDIKSIYNRMFPNGTQTNSASAQAKLNAQNLLQKSVLDHAANDFSNLAGKMSTLDAARLSAHAAAIRDLESRLSIVTSTTSACGQLSAGAASTGSYGAGAAYSANADVDMRLIQTALACDLTRVATLYASQAPDDCFGYQPDMSGTSDFHDIVHKTNGTAASGKTVPPLGDDPVAMATVTAYHTFNASLFAKFLGLLQAVPQSDGTTLLDNTLVVWCGQLASGDHSLDRIPYILAGGTSLGVKTGRYVMLPRKASTNWPAYSTGIPHNNLFVSLANLMGMSTTTFGNPSVCTGPLTQVLS